MPKTKKANTKTQAVYLAEFISDTNCWEWWDIYDPRKHSLISIFEAYLADYLGEEISVEMSDLKVEGLCYTHREHDFRVWKLQI